MVRRFWREKFLALQNGARILDIAAGNGAIATIAAELSNENGSGFFIAATDLAEIHTDLISDDKTRKARGTIEFHSRTPCEKQPFDNDSFDIVTSQFGFEYSDIDKTLLEVRRILMPDGRFVAISHHVDSVLIEAAQVEREIYRLALDELDLVGTTKHYFQVLGDLTRDPKQFETAQPSSEQVNTKMNEFSDKYGDHDCAKFIIGTISFVARSAMQTTYSERLEALDKAESDFKMARARLDDMATAAMDYERTEMFKIEARCAGFQSVHCLKIFGDDNGLAGWQLHLR